MTTTAAAASRVEMFGLDGLPPVKAGDCLANLILEAVERQNEPLQNDDVVVVAQKIVSKAEGRLVDLSTVEPCARARDIAAACGKDPRLVEVVLGESSEVLRAVSGVIIVVHRLGWVMANAGVDQSNLEDNAGNDKVLLLPCDPDDSARRLCDALQQRQDASVGVVINDSFGRAWRQGTVGTALGVAGWPALIDQRGQADLYGRPLASTVIGHADEIAAAASIVQGQAGEGRPVVILRGLTPNSPCASGQELIRPAHMDLFR